MGVGPARRTRHVLALATVLIVSLVLAACGGGDAPLDAAEPEQAPELAEEPAGSVRQAAPLPEGVVYEPMSDSLAVAVREPNRLLILDPKTLRERRSAPLPGKVRHLQVTKDGIVLVPSEQADQLIEVDPDKGVVRRTAVARYPHDAAAAANGDIVVAEEFGGSAAVLRDGEIIHRFDDLTQPGGVVVDGDIAVVVDVEAFTITSYDLSARERVTRLEAGQGPTHVAMAGDNRVAVTDTRGDRVLLYSVDPLELIDKMSLEGRPYGIAADVESETVWVTLTERNQVVGLYVSGDKPIEVERLPTVRQPNSVAVSPGADRLWVTGTSEGEIQRIER